MSYKHEIPIMFGDPAANSITLAGTTAQTSNILDLREDDEWILVVETTGATGHAGTATTVQVSPCDSAGTIEDDQTVLDQVSVATASAALKKEMWSPTRTSGVALSADDIARCFMYAKVVATGGDAASSVTFAARLLARRSD